MTPLEVRARQLFDEHGDSVYALARRYADPGDAEDLAQEMWTRIMKGLPKMNPDAKAGGWVTITAMNAAKDWLRYRKRWRGLKRRAAQLFAWDQQETRTSPKQDGLAPFIQRELWAAVMELPDLQMRVILCRYVSEMSIKETAEYLGKAQGTVQASQHRALRTLRERLERFALQDQP